MRKSNIFSKWVKIQLVIRLEKRPIKTLGATRVQIADREYDINDTIQKTISNEYCHYK